MNFSYFRTNKQLSLSWPTRSRSLSTLARSKAEPRWPLQEKGPSQPVRGRGPWAVVGVRGSGKGGGLPALTPCLSLTALRVEAHRPASEPKEAMGLRRQAPSPWGPGSGGRVSPSATSSVGLGPPGLVPLSVTGCRPSLAVHWGWEQVGDCRGCQGSFKHGLMPGARSPGVWGVPWTGMRAPTHTETS